jgi:hypothetical protein
MKTGGFTVQLEVFYELNAAAISANLRSSEAAGAETGPGIFKTPEDRHFMLALMLHCADISNAVKPIAIAEKCARAHALPGWYCMCACIEND